MSLAAVEEVAAVDPGTGEPILTHILNCPPDKESTAAWIMEARVFGLPVTALCGKTWVPERDPKRYPICTACTDAAGLIIFEGA